MNVKYFADTDTLYIELYPARLTRRGIWTRTRCWRWTLPAGCAL